MTHSPTLRIFTFFLAAFLSISSGIIASSDGVTIFNVTQAIVERGEITIGGGNVSIGVAGKLYSRYGIALSVVAIPLYLFGKLLSAFVPSHFNLLTLKGSVSLTNAIIGALACLLLVNTGHVLGYSRKVSFQLAMAFGFSTLFVVYATKSFLTQPLETLCLVGTLYWLIAHSRHPRLRNLSWAGFFCGLGVLTKWVFIINLPIFLGYLLVISGTGRRARGLLVFSAPVALFVALALGYNYARYGSILETGYWTTTGFTTPLFVGLHGLLLSPGKSLFLYAPITALGVVAMWRFSKSHKREMWLMLGLFAINLLVIAQYRVWHGEGGWGPRYLTLVLPCLVLPIGTLLETGQVAFRRLFLVLSLTGLLVQFGGASIYYGTYYRVIGEYPYRTSASDPRFMYKAHYVPRYSPAWGQFNMARENWGKFLRGERPTMTIGPGNERIPLSAADVSKLRDTLDLWFAYAYYAGVPFGPCLFGMIGLMGAAATMGWTLYLLIEGAERGAP